MKCPKCQTQNREGAEFCIQCSESPRLQVVCPQCGAYREDGTVDEWWFGGRHLVGGCFQWARELNVV